VSLMSQVPDYLEKISHPMDFSTMQSKIDSHCYATIDQFEDDFQLMINNCMTYNEKGSVFYRIAVKLQREVSISARFYTRSIVSGLIILHYSVLGSLVPVFDCEWAYHIALFGIGSTRSCV